MSAAKTALAAPQRIQRKRTKGWRMPEGAVYVGRPSGWGNPFKVGETFWMTKDNGATLEYVLPRDADEAIVFFRWWVSHPDRMATVRQLRGKDLACWCPLDAPCHADVLLELANR